ncbi:MAG: flagellar assembly protein FliW [Christensenellales bacterium]
MTEEWDGERMYVETNRFGSFELKDNKIINFPLGIPGFEELHKFIILEITESKPLYWLQSIENKYVALPAIIPFEFFEDHYIEVRDSELEELHIESKNDLIILNVVVIPSNMKEMTVNLAAPIIVNVKEGIGKQIIIDAAELPVRYPIYEIIMKTLKGGKEDAGAH